MSKGKLIISLDFEIYWGIRDVVKLEDYQQNLLGVQKVIPRLLKMFEQYKINATFATVGFLFFQTKEELLEHLPEKKPQYADADLSPYRDNFNFVGADETQDPFHFGSGLIDQIKNAGQEIGSHTFSHYYCLEKGQTKEDFLADIKAAKNIASKKSIEMKSFVFPRNQYSHEYLKICREEGFTSFRGNEKSWLFSSKSYGYGTRFRRPFRLIDSYVNLSGHNCYPSAPIKKNDLTDIPSSRFLRPYSKWLKTFENRRLKRIKDSMTYAAKNGLTYHLWWHPHNFGMHTEENFSFLEKILIHFLYLNKEYNFESMNMKQFAAAARADEN
jgi:peptidoglycan/xylan/chitin deacetylase (PgdA/CDA1 family)